MEDNDMGVLERTRQWKIENMSEAHNKHINHWRGKQEWKGGAEGNKIPARKSLMY